MTIDQKEIKVHSNRYRATIFMLVAPLLFAACGGDSATQPATNDQVTIELIAFKPMSLTVQSGDTVIWKQLDPGFHTITSGTVEQGGAGVTQHPDGKFDSGQVGTGGTYEFTFTEPGLYTYYCQIHPATMRAEIQVT